MDGLKYCVKKFFALLQLDSDSSDAHFYKEYISNAVLEFIDNGVKKEAYDVYSLFLDIYRINISGQQSFIDLFDVLRKYEENAAVLIDKQRDHYVHSVNVFLLGLGIYAQNQTVRDSFEHNLKNSGKHLRYFSTVHEEFFFMWGIAALFHDAGYPVEIINKQLKKFISFISGQNDKGEAAAGPYLAYFDFDKINSIADFDPEKFVFPRDTTGSEALTDQLSLSISRTFDLELSAVKETVDGFLSLMQRYQFVDHGFYSALIILKWFGELMQKRSEPNCLLFGQILDSASAVFLHNAYRNIFLKAPYELPPMNVGQHPLAYLLIFCDEAQEWNREAYGVETKKMVQVDDSKVEIDDIRIKLHYITRDRVVGEGFTTEKCRSLDMLLDIRGVFRDGISLSATTLTERYISKLASEEDRLTPRVLIEHIEMIASKIHQRYNDKQKKDHPDRPLAYPDWETLPDTLKYSNVRQVRDMVYKLEDIGCFVSEDSDHEKVVELTAAEVEYLSKKEHDSWVDERVRNGWQYAEVKNVKSKTSPYLVPYEELAEDIKELDRSAVRDIIPLLHEVGLKVYRTAGTEGL